MASLAALVLLGSALVSAEPAPPSLVSAEPSASGAQGPAPSPMTATSASAGVGVGVGVGESAVVPVEPFGVPLPKLLLPGPPTTVALSDVPDGAVAAVVRLSAAPADVDPAAGAAERAQTVPFTVALSGTGRDELIVSSGSRPVEVTASVEAFVIPPEGSPSSSVTTAFPFVIDCDLALAPAPTPPATPTPVDEDRALAVSGTVLRDSGGAGEVVDLRGTNLGGWLLQEGWMSPAGEAPLVRSAWEAWATATEDGGWAGAALDGDPATRWSSGREQTVGDAFIVDLGAATTFDQVSLDAGPSSGDYPPAYVVRASHDGGSWWDVASGRGTGQRITVATGYQTARFIQLTITEADPNRHWWSIAELSASVSDEFNTRRVLTERFGPSVADSLVARYQDAWIRESDLDAISDLGMTMVRVPIDWQVLMRPDGTMRPDEDAFRKLDWLVAETAERGLYVVLDLHGAPGAACPWQSCGQAGSNRLWSSAEDQDRTVRIWQRIAARYAGDPTIAAYDLLNEPLVTMGELESTAQTRQKFDLYDRLYDAVRAVDPDHIIIVAAFYSWENALPASEYGWTNVMYETHHYRFDAAGDHAAMERFVDEELARLAQVRGEWQVPVYAGEFWLGPEGFEDVYARWLSGLDGLNASWSSWTYKVRGGGNWGLHQHNGSAVPDLANDSAEAIGAAWDRYTTAGFTPNGPLQAVFSAAATRPSTPTVPTTIQAEAYVAMAGLGSEPTADGGGGLDLGWTDAGDMAEYEVLVPAAGTYRITFRVASPTGATRAARVVTSASSARVSIAATGGWQNWTEVTTTVRLEAGRQRVRLEVEAPGWNLNWLRLDDA